MKITSVKAKVIKDSRGRDTVEASINGFSSSCPSGKSTGMHEAIQIDAKLAVKKINELKKDLVGKDFTQSTFDNLLIKRAGKQKKIIGGNSTTALSIAFAKATSKGKLFQYTKLLGGSKKFVMPVPMINVLNGGTHGRNNLAIQEFMILPLKAKNFSQSLKMSSEIFHELGNIVMKKFHTKQLGDEGGYSPPIENTLETLELITNAIENSGYSNETRISLDAAASQFFSNGKYNIDGLQLSPSQMIDYYLELKKKYNLFSIEDPFYENDFLSFAELSKKMLVVGDDITVSNRKRIEQAAEESACKGIILKVNQIGTFSEAIDAAKTARKNEMIVIVSHRSGETMDPFITDIAVGLGSGFIKTGSMFQKERAVKYKRVQALEKLIKNVSYGLASYI